MVYARGLTGRGLDWLTNRNAADLKSEWSGRGAGNHLAKWIDQLDGLSRLPPGWNRQGAPAPSKEAIGAARRFIEAMINDGQAPTRVAASAVGGVGVTRQIGDRMAYVEFYNDGTACALLADNAGEERVVRVTPEPGTVRDLLDEVKAYLNG